MWVVEVVHTAIRDMLGTNSARYCRGAALKSVTVTVTGQMQLARHIATPSAEPRGAEQTVKILDDNLVVHGVGERLSQAKGGCVWRVYIGATSYP
jgi:hypothetical protein